jgi:diacylglycerol kinase
MIPLAPRWSTAPAQRGWRRKFAEAGRGIKRGMRGQSSFAVHVFAAMTAIAAAAVLSCTYLEWCVLVACIGAVFTAELFNSSVETLFHGLDRATKERLAGVLDIAAGAVLVASITAAIAGTIVFVHRVNALITS